MTTLTKSGKPRKMIGARKGVKTKTEIAREIMTQVSGQKTYKEVVELVRNETKLSRELAARYVKTNAKRVANFSTTDGKF